MFTNFAIKLVVACIIVAGVSFFASRQRVVPNLTLEVTAIRTSIHDLTADPDKFADLAVKFDGVVGNRITVLGYGGYRVHDPLTSEAITVLSRSTPPPMDQRITVTGLWKPAFQIGAYSLNVVVQE